jgi:hypothetical protein
MPTDKTHVASEKVLSYFGIVATEESVMSEPLDTPPKGLLACEVCRKRKRKVGKTPFNDKHPLTHQDL